MYNWPHSFSCGARCLKGQRSCHSNATYYSCHNHDPVPAKFKHVTNIETCTLLCSDHIMLWKALDVNMVENGAHCSDKNVKILVRYQWIGPGGYFHRNAIRGRAAQMGRFLTKIPKHGSHF